jgi:hypothetical protein
VGLGQRFCDCPAVIVSNRKARQLYGFPNKQRSIHTVLLSQHKTMSVIQELHKLDQILDKEQLEQLDAAAEMHQEQSGIEFRIAEVEGEVVHIETSQSERRSGKYANEAALFKRTREVFEKRLKGMTLEVKVFPHLPSPTSVVNTKWLESKMNEKGVRIKQIAFDTGVDRESIADWVSGKRSMSQIVKAMFYFYLSK